LSTEVATQDDAAVAAANEVAEQLAKQQEAEYDPDESLSTPILKVGQALTKEVQDGNAEAGEFINTLTNEGIGDTVEFIPAYYNKGRFASDSKTSRSFVAFGPEIPEAWADLVGEEFVGTPFAEYPEADEQFKAAVNAKEREWGHGPLVSTTHNYTGYVVVEDEEGEKDYQPVRISFKRTDVPAHRKINTLKKAVLRNRPYWDMVLQLKTVKKEFNGKAAFVVSPSDIKNIRDTDVNEKTIASELALAVAAGRTQSVGAEDALADKAVEPKSSSDLDV
jgi:hypothetical protein